MHRRHFLHHTSALLGASVLAPSSPLHAGQFTGKIRKSLKWGMAQKVAKEMPLVEAFKKLRACGYEGGVLDAGCWMLDAGCWMLEGGGVKRLQLRRNWATLLRGFAAD